jgi:hypothetical protein
LTPYVSESCNFGPLCFKIALLTSYLYFLLQKVNFDTASHLSNSAVTSDFFFEEWNVSFTYGDGLMREREKRVWEKGIVTMNWKREGKGRCSHGNITNLRTVSLALVYNLTILVYYQLKWDVSLSQWKITVFRVWHSRYLCIETG